MKNIFASWISKRHFCHMSCLTKTINSQIDFACLSLWSSDYPIIAWWRHWWPIARPKMYTHMTGKAGLINLRFQMMDPENVKYTMLDLFEYSDYLRVTWIPELGRLLCYEKEQSLTLIFLKSNFVLGHVNIDEMDHLLQHCLVGV